MRWSLVLLCGTLALVRDKKWDPTGRSGVGPAISESFWEPQGEWIEKNDFENLKQEFKSISADQCWVPTMPDNLYQRPRMSAHTDIPGKAIQWERQGSISSRDGASMMDWSQMVLSHNPFDISFDYQGLHVSSVRRIDSNKVLDTYLVYGCDGSRQYKLEFLKPKRTRKNGGRVTYDSAVHLMNMDNLLLASGHWEQGTDGDQFRLEKGRQGGPLLATMTLTNTWRRDDDGKWGHQPDPDQGGVLPYYLEFRQLKPGAALFANPANNILDPSKRWILSVTAAVVAVREAEQAANGRGLPEAYIIFLVLVAIVGLLILYLLTQLGKSFYALVYPGGKTGNFGPRMGASDMLSRLPGYGTPGRFSPVGV
mmetsp:Transcript_6584/g.15709  ORF Transcript_6584/g.15709 Transcript_6584/m.15709 type:complete len:367 (+) Transcript_6584:149-1249(+)